MKTLSCLLLIFVCLGLLDIAVSSRFLRKQFLERKREQELRERGEDLPPDQWIETRLDHFNIADTRTWKQRYFVNDAFYKPGGPVFLMIGGESEQNPIWMIEGAWIEDAKRFGAYLLSLEHRYYGKSHPTRDMSVSNLAYLSSDQAMEDLAYFINKMKSDLNLTSNPWVVFGGSYPGSLAAWFRMKYPHLIVGAVATSAPLFAQLNFKEYVEITSQSLYTESPVPNCNENIEEAMKELEELIKTKEGRKTITEKFNLCDPLRPWRKDDTATLFQAIAESFNGVVQYNKDNRAFKGSKATEITIDVVCNIMALDNKSPLDRLATVTNALTLAYGQECFEYSYSAFLDNYGAKSWESAAAVGGRQWFYQTCTEFGWFQSSDSPNHPFGPHFPVELMLQQCIDLFGKKFTREFIEAGIERTNTKYGGYDIPVSNIVFPNGSVDQWHFLGILEDLSEEAKAVFVNGTAHCATMYPPEEADPPQLVEARKQITEAIASWIQA